jgi:hypothetical protein
MRLNKVPVFWLFLMAVGVSTARVYSKSASGCSSADNHRS